MFQLQTNRAYEHKHVWMTIMLRQSSYLMRPENSKHSATHTHTHAGRQVWELCVPEIKMETHTVFF